MRSLLLLVAAIVAIVAGLTAMHWSNNGAPASAPVTAAQQDVSATSVVVAKQDIPVGTIITEDMLDKQPWPSQLVLEGFVTAEPKDSGIIGKVARAPIQAREPIVLSRLASADAPGFLASSLASGMRAVTVATDPVTGVGGYVFAGDRVDLLFVHNVTGQNGPPVSEVLAPSVRVLAVNVRDQTAGLASVVTGAAGAPSTVTIEVNEEMAQKIRLAEKVGTLSLSLRSMHDKDKKNNFKVTYVGDLSNASMQSGGDVRIIRGTAAEEAKQTLPLLPAGGSIPGVLGGLLR